MHLLLVQLAVEEFVTCFTVQFRVLLIFVLRITLKVKMRKIVGLWPSFTLHRLSDKRRLWLSESKVPRITVKGERCNKMYSEFKQILLSFFWVWINNFCNSDSLPNRNFAVNF
jgi:hypothetical protein